MLIPELLSPAGEQESLEAALRYGADAVYLGGNTFGMRQGAVFEGQALSEAIAYAHTQGAKAYVCCNTLPTNDDLETLPDFLRMVSAAKADALIVADVGVLALAKELTPELELHASTQTGIMNWYTASELYRMGASRVVLARELPLEDIRRIREKVPPELMLEAFVHGAMCMSVSGRCVISSYLTGRNANRGECAQPCRWGYHLMEEKRPGEYYPVFEDEQGSYILNAKDLCMLEYLDQLAAAGIGSFKIEGRAKSAYYAAVITNAYRGALDSLAKTVPGQPFTPPAWAVEEVYKVSHREYSTGFYFDKPNQSEGIGGYIRTWEFIASVQGYEDGCLRVCGRNRFAVGDEVEIMLPGCAPEAFRIGEIRDAEEGPVQAARHPMRSYLIPYEHAVPVGAMLRRPLNKTIEEKG